jgi:hypothetical protein
MNSAFCKSLSPRQKYFSAEKSFGHTSRQSRSGLALLQAFAAHPSLPTAKFLILLFVAGVFKMV